MAEPLAVTCLGWGWCDGRGVRGTVQRQRQDSMTVWMDWSGCWCEHGQVEELRVGVH